MATELGRIDLIMNPRRIKSFIVDFIEVLRVMNYPKGDAIQVLRDKRWPDDAEVVHVRERMEYHGFEIILQHDSFPEVECGESCPHGGMADQIDLVRLPLGGEKEEALDVICAIAAEFHFGRMGSQAACSSISKELIRAGMIVPSSEEATA